MKHIADNLINGSKKASSDTSNVSLSIPNIRQHIRVSVPPALKTTSPVRLPLSLYLSHYLSLSLSLFLFFSLRLPCSLSLYLWLCLSLSPKSPILSISLSLSLSTLKSSFSTSLFKYSCRCMEFRERSQVLWCQVVFQLTWLHRCSRLFDRPLNTPPLKEAIVAPLQILYELLSRLVSGATSRFTITKLGLKCVSQAWIYGGCTVPPPPHEF